ncbi:MULTISPECIES: TMEM175 family protein [Methanobacterium]|uniref:DUF1211 domain-containing protein n=1 Tax=Methanobacterium subterraneum TaxID=59277 RepID=A0A2H4VS76_9EURY|nr:MULTISPECIES: TMEM175 family protein [Methanobacterium]MBW4256403.1 DUF1211 domain-containing protein [Methanobacterium sp. YSL]PKL73997.1 MAG: DUF1211 domain-containing protein [Methanobacteriales archaeon HGW-Methanobacteriales-2]AUB55190.1 hypothetical protein BK007_03620 [Methanobacterium subterraneum]AUB57823.1 hypothetical protein BK008_05510 [Methanobacterium sp. MZ-A1]AUB60949.1 hypothetical protein BK009_09840 [Methanobacterium subterraneum]
MQDNEKTVKSTGINVRRIETLVDGIFAIAMTLLVLGIAVPSVANPTEASLYKALFDLLPNFYSYFISFVLLAVFWRINHLQFNRIKRADGTLLWIIIIWLLFVALVPFSAFFVGEYGNFQIPNIFFDLNLFFIGFLLFLNWRHAINQGLVDKVDEETLKSSLKVNLMLPVISLVAAGITFLPFMNEWGYGWSSLVYLIIPLLKRYQ